MRKSIYSNPPARGKGWGYRVMRGASSMVNGLDKFASRHGRELGMFLQQAAPLVAEMGAPQVGVMAGALGKGLQTYQDVRGQVGP